MSKSQADPARRSQSLHAVAVIRPARRQHATLRAGLDLRWLFAPTSKHCLEPCFSTFAFFFALYLSPIEALCYENGQDGLHANQGRGERPNRRHQGKQGAAHLGAVLRVQSAFLTKCAQLQFNRPKALNTFTTQLLKETINAVRELNEDPETVFTVLTGDGRYFSAGADITGTVFPHQVCIQRETSPSILSFDSSFIQAEMESCCPIALTQRPRQRWRLPPPCFQVSINTSFLFKDFSTNILNQAQSWSAL